MTAARADAASQQIARDARERFARAVIGVAALVETAITDRLLSLASQAAGARAMQTNRDNLLAFQGRSAEWTALLKQHWGRLPSRASSAAPSNTLLRLELMGDDIVENNILSSRLTQVLEDKGGFDLNDLRLRIQHLEGSTELSTDDVFRPDTLARLLVDQWLAAGLDRLLWTQMQDVVQAKLVEVVVPAYRDANVFLVERGVMKEIDLKGLVRRVGGGASGPAPLAPRGVVGDLRSTAGSGETAGIPSKGQAIGSSNSPVSQRDRGWTGGGIPFGVARQRAQDVLLNLKRFVTAQLRGSGGGSGPGAQDAGPGYRDTTGSDTGTDLDMIPAFAAAIDAAEAAGRAAASHYLVGHEPTSIEQNVADIRRRSGEVKRRAPTTADKATVEIVALMFQAILAEDRIPFSARVWFARLQMPVLRVALAEPEFFGTLQHPARLLIDRMGSCVMGFDAAAISGSALEGEIRRVVQVIEQYPETGERVFKLVFEEFVSFLGKYLTQSDATQRVMSVAQQVEQKETMAIQYTIELRKMLNDMPVRDEIREFLFRVWAEVLAIAALRYGAQDEQTVLLKQAAADLVWAASAKPSRTDRTQVIANLPPLLQRLRQGMTLLGIVGEPQELHIKRLGTTLSDAFLSKTEAIPQARIDAMAKHLAHLEDFVSDVDSAEELPLDAASIELLLGTDASSIEVVPDTGMQAGPDMVSWAQELQVGSWFMLDHSGRVRQVQFVWRSDRKRLHLFASGDGQSFLIQAGRLASYLQTGLLVPAEEESLTARATRKALAKLDANPERLLN